MELRIMDSEVGSRRLHDDSPAARKLLAAPAPSPYVSTNLCHDVKSGVAVSCQNPHTLVIIVAGMACMIFLVTIALVLLLWSVVRQRRIERLRREAGDAESPEQTSTSSSSSIGTAAAPASGVLPVDSPEFKDAVFVQLPGDEKPQFFALPKPFLADALPEQEVKNPTEMAIKAEEKEPSSEDPNSRDADSQHDPVNPEVEDACVPSADGHFHNPLFAPR